MSKATRILRTSYHETADYRVRVAIEIVFSLLFLVNVILFLNGEYMIYLRARLWYRAHVKPLSQIERHQRERFKPALLRRCAIVCRFASLNFLAHIAMTLTSEFIWYSTIAEINTMSEEIGTFPV